MASPYSHFTPDPSRTTRLDFTFWDEVLKESVLYTGPSLRERASRPYPIVGSRLTRGHTSHYRLEGNKVLFEGFDDDFTEMLGHYVEDLVAIANRVDLTSLPRDEQLAYWLSLHNVLVVHAIAENYPLSSPSRIKGADGLRFHDTKRVTIDGVVLSLRNIRQDIVYANWANPLVIYGFFHGDIGSPSLQRKAYAGNTVWDTLRFSGTEFANSLRGFIVYGDEPKISRHYDDAAPYFFAVDFNADVRRHMNSLLTPEVKTELADATAVVKIARYEADVADMTKGTNDRIQLGNVYSATSSGTTKVPTVLARAVNETGQKMTKIRRRGLFSTVTIEDIQTVPQEDRLSSGLPIEMELPDPSQNTGSSSDSDEPSD
ncbi:hypothetical protein GCM10007854_02970 [Algimonas porphyrae]|uniref:DUF547 domain-containing protein n=2 Tax=Algimonas porphyrae TaxID=1128113 RepID=A0ABQ5UZD1_9PROT|nr:hypothetical protein GCM10007854_02970 [Algimonas porphyrae]